MARAAAATRMLADELERAGTAATSTSRRLRTADTNTNRFSRSVDTLNGRLTQTQIRLNALGGAGIGGRNGPLGALGNQASHSAGRMRLLLDAIALLGPAAIPIGAVAVPAVAGLAAQLGFATLAGGTAILAFQGVGDALKAVNKAALEPTTDNILAARMAMERLSPAAKDLVKQLRSMREVGGGLQDAAAEGFLPGVTESLRQLEKLAPRLEALLHETGDAFGDLLADSATSLATERWTEFMEFLTREARPNLVGLGEAVGNIAHGVAELWMAFDPLNDDFLSVLVNASQSFDQWAGSLDQTQGFADFLAYVREQGPQVAATFQALGSALIDIAVAAAPIGGPVLQGIEALAKGISAIAESDLGTPIFTAVAAMAVLTRGMKLFGAVGGAAWLANIRGANGFIAQAAAARRAAVVGGAALGALAIAQTGVADSAGLTNTAMLGLIGTMAGPYGAAAGAAIGLTTDLAKANNNFEDSIHRLQLASEQWDLTALLAAQEAALNDFKAAIADDSFTGNMRRISMFLSDDHNEFANAMAVSTDRVDELRAGASGLAAILAPTINESARAAQAAAASTSEFAASVQHLSNLLDKRAAIRDYQAALDDYTASIKENGRTLNINSAAGRANQQALDAVAETAIRVGKAMTDGSRRVAFLREVRADMAKIAKTSPEAARQVQLLTRDIQRLTARPAKAKVEVDTKPAARELDGFEATFLAFGTKTSTGKVKVDVSQARPTLLEILGLQSRADRDITSTITTIHRQVNTGFGPQTYASGGFTGRGRRYDVAGVVHRGEVVIPQDLVRRDWAMLRTRYGHLPGFADGGVVGRQGTPNAAAVGPNGQIIPEAESLRAALRRLTMQVKASEKAVNRERAERDRIRSAQQQLGSSVRGAFRSDIFAAPENVWAADANADPKARLREDIAKSREFIQLVKQLKAKGLDGAALGDILSRGDVDLARMWAQMSRRDIAEFEQLYNTRERVSAAAGSAAGQAVFGERLANANEELREANRELRDVNKELRQVKQAIEKSSQKTADALGKKLDGVAAKSRRGQRL